MGRGSRWFHSLATLRIECPAVMSCHAPHPYKRVLQSFGTKTMTLMLAMIALGVGLWLAGVGFE